MQDTLISYADELLEGYGMRNRARCRVARPRAVEDVRAVFDSARRMGETVTLRGGGCSYGDAALNRGHIVLDCSAMNRVLAYDAGTGVVTVEPGVTIAQLWQLALADGWWPPVVPGTMAVTIGGAAAANIHGKNNWRDGCFGDHIASCELMLPSGEILACSPEQNPDLFYAAVGSFGLLGCFVSLTLRLRRIYSGFVSVRQTAHGSLDRLIGALEEGTASATHLVGWVDTGARGAHLGRGLLKAMRELEPGEDPAPALSLDPAKQPPSDRIAGIIPVAWIPTLGRPLASPLGIRLANRAQWIRGNLPGADRPHLERYVPANFMLNFIPNFRYIYRPGGLIQHQSFMPRGSASAVFREILERSRAAGLAPSLAVLKKHRPSSFLLNYLRDGYSLALDYAVPRGTESALLALLGDLNTLVAQSGGSFFLAKDSTLMPEQFRIACSAEALARFGQLKRQYDPSELIQSDIYRRVLGPAMRAETHATEQPSPSVGLPQS